MLVVFTDRSELEISGLTSVPSVFLSLIAIRVQSPCVLAFGGVWNYTASSRAAQCVFWELVFQLGLQGFII